MKQVTMIVQDQDMQKLQPILDKMGITYQQTNINPTIPEVNDPEALEILNNAKDDEMLSPEETKAELKKLGLDI